MEDKDEINEFARAYNARVSAMIMRDLRIKERERAASARAKEKEREKTEKERPSYYWEEF